MKNYNFVKYNLDKPTLLNLEIIRNAVIKLYLVDQIQEILSKITTMLIKVKVIYENKEKPSALTKSIYLDTQDDWLWFYHNLVLSENGINHNKFNSNKLISSVVFTYQIKN